MLKYLKYFALGLSIVVALFVATVLFVFALGLGVGQGLPGIMYPKIYYSIESTQSYEDRQEQVAQAGDRPVISFNFNQGINSLDIWVTGSVNIEKKSGYKELKIIDVAIDTGDGQWYTILQNKKYSLEKKYWQEKLAPLSEPRVWIDLHPDIFLRIRSFFLSDLSVLFYKPIYIERSKSMIRNKKIGDRFIMRVRTMYTIDGGEKNEIISYYKVVTARGQYLPWYFD